MTRLTQRVLLQESAFPPLKDGPFAYGKTEPEQPMLWGRGAPTRMPAVLGKRIGNGEAKRLSAILRPFEQAAAYVAKNHAALLKEYPEQWIAVAGDRVVATSPSKIGLARKLKNLHIDAGDLEVTFLTNKPQTLIL